jgi:hypothetical protein
MAEDGNRSNLKSARQPKKRAKTTCRTCEARFRSTRQDARYCSAACRQRAHRLRSDDVQLLLQKIDACRRLYWELVLELGATLGLGQSEVMSNYLSQYVDEEGYVYQRGEPIGKIIKSRPGWASWGLEAAGPPFCPPGRKHDDEDDVIKRAKRNGSVTDKRKKDDKRNAPVTRRADKTPAEITP